MEKTTLLRKGLEKGEEQVKGKGSLNDQRWVGRENYKCYTRNKCSSRQDSRGCWLCRLRVLGGGVWEESNSKQLVWGTFLDFSEFPHL